MVAREAGPEPDSDVLADFLSCLAYAPRLELLRALRVPQALGDMKMQVRRGSHAPEHLASRPAVLRHVEKLTEAGLLSVEQAERDGRPVRLYATNAPKLYAILEDLRRMCLQYAGDGGTGDATGTLAPGPRPHAVKGPRLVLVHGLYEGRAYPLERAGDEPRWLIGRRRGVTVCLDYDPYVSLENASIARHAGQYVLTDAAESKNGTSVNWARLPKGGAHALAAGDVIGVGRSLLSFVPA